MSLNAFLSAFLLDRLSSSQMSILFVIRLCPCRVIAKSPTKIYLTVFCCKPLQSFKISLSKMSNYLLIKGLCVITALFIVCWILYKRVAIKKRSVWVRLSASLMSSISASLNFDLFSSMRLSRSNLVNHCG